MTEDECLKRIKERFPDHFIKMYYRYKKDYIFVLSRTKEEVDIDVTIARYRINSESGEISFFDELGEVMYGLIERKELNKAFRQTVKYIDGKPPKKNRRK